MHAGLFISCSYGSLRTNLNLPQDRININNNIAIMNAYNKTLKTNIKTSMKINADNNIIKTYNLINIIIYNYVIIII